MKLREIVTGHDYPRIMYRTNGPEGEDILFGYCSYVGGVLRSSDGDYYSLDDEIEHFVVDDDPSHFADKSVESELICYFHSDYTAPNHP